MVLAALPVVLSGLISRHNAGSGAPPKQEFSREFPSMSEALGYLRLYTGTEGVGVLGGVRSFGDLTFSSGDEELSGEDANDLLDFASDPDLDLDLQALDDIVGEGGLQGSSALDAYKNIASNYTNSDAGGFVEVDGQRTYFSGANTGITEPSSNPTGGTSGGTNNSTSGSTDNGTSGSQTGSTNDGTSGSTNNGTSGSQTGSNNTNTDTGTDTTNNTTNNTTTGGGSSSSGSSSTSFITESNISGPNVNKLGIPYVQGEGTSKDIVNGIIQGMNDEKTALHAVSGLISLDESTQIRDVFSSGEGTMFTKQDGSLVSREEILSSNNFNLMAASGFYQDVKLSQPLQNYEALIQAGVPVEHIQVEPLPPMSLDEVELPDFSSLTSTQEGTLVGRGEPTDIQPEGLPDQTVTDLTGDSGQ